MRGVSRAVEAETEAPIAGESLGEAQRAGEPDPWPSRRHALSDRKKPVGRDVLNVPPILSQARPPT